MFANIQIILLIKTRPLATWRMWLMVLIIFFVGIGPDLAKKKKKKITERVPMENVALDYLMDRNPSSMFLNSCIWK